MVARPPDQSRRSLADLPSRRKIELVVMPTLRDILDHNVREAAPELYDKPDRNRVRCYSCGHCCPIPEGQPGV